MPERIALWDPFLRLFHWSLLVFCALAYFTDGDPPQLHSQAGYTVALLVVFRIIWGFAGPRHALFRSFIPSFSALKDYLAELRSAPRPHHAGHDPAGAVMIVMLLVLLTATAATGMMLFAMEGSGPIPTAWVASLHGGTLEIIHTLLAETTAVLVILHICGVIIMSFLQRENLIAAMLTGKKYPREND